MKPRLAVLAPPLGAAALLSGCAADSNVSYVDPYYSPYPTTEVVYDDGYPYPYYHRPYHSYSHYSHAYPHRPHYSGAGHHTGGAAAHATHATAHAAPASAPAPGGGTPSPGGHHHH